MLHTTNYNLSKPELTDTVGVSIPALSANMDILDGMDMVVEKSLGTSGYIKYKSGFMIQWGVSDIYAKSGTAITFTKPFDTICIGAIATPHWDSMVGNIYFVTISKTKTSANFTAIGDTIQSTQYGSTTWFAMGY